MRHEIRRRLRDPLSRSFQAGGSLARAVRPHPFGGREGPGLPWATAPALFHTAHRNALREKHKRGVVTPDETLRSGNRRDAGRPSPARVLPGGLSYHMATNRRTEPELRRRNSARTCC
jgi:hypothetical protein